MIKNKRPRINKIFVSSDEYEKIKSDSVAAKEILEDERFEFIRSYLKNAKESIVDMFLANRIKQVDERIKISSSLTKIFRTSKKEQEDELVGKYKFINDFMSDLENFANSFDELAKAIEEKKVSVDSKNE